MRKKSHISLSRFLITNINKEELTSHRKAFYFGSILPDCIPSFVTRRHTFDDTFHIVQKEIEKILEEHSLTDMIDARFCRKLGVVTHYIADYFTFPHNKNYPGSLKDHCKYEKLLKHQLKEYVQRRDCCQYQMARDEESQFTTLEELFIYIEQIHNKYLMKLSEVKKDIVYIVETCVQVVDAILRLIEIQAKDKQLIPQTVL